MPSTIDLLQEILGVVRSTFDACELHPIPSTVSPSDETFLLPPAPSIDAALYALGPKTTLAEKLCRAYELFALRLRDTSEAKWRHTISACHAVNKQFGLSTYDSRPIRQAASQVHMRTLQEMAVWVITSYREHVEHAQRSFMLSAIPKEMSGASQSRSWQRIQGLEHAEQNNSAAISLLSRAHCPRSAAFVPSAQISRSTFSYSGNNASTVSTLVLADVSQAVSCRTPVWRNVADSENAPNHDDRIEAQRPHCAYPSRYVHQRLPPQHRLPSKSEDFLAPARKPAPRKPRLAAIEDKPEDLIGSFKALCFKQSGGCVGKGCSPLPSSSLDAFLLPPRDKLSGVSLDARSSNPRISISSVPASTASKTVRRRVAALPRRVTPLPPYPSPPSCTSASLSSSVAESPVAAPSVVTDRGTPTPSAEMRKRKVISLPRRQPRHPGGSLSPPSSSSSKRVPVCISRTPSLVSLSSTRSDSPCPSDEGPDTPPSSPRMYIRDFSSEGPEDNVLSTLVAPPISHSCHLSSQLFC